MAVKRLLSKAKRVGRKIKNEGKAAIKVAKYGARSFGKLSGVKKAAVLAAAPLAPLAYGASHGFRKPKKALGVVKDIAVGAAKQIIGIPGRVAQFHKESVQEDWNKLKKKGKVN